MSDDGRKTVGQFLDELITAARDRDDLGDLAGWTWDFSNEGGVDRHWVNGEALE